jgi:hypothetical protein
MAKNGIYNGKKWQSIAISPQAKIKPFRAVLILGYINILPIPQKAVKSKI